MFPEGLAPLAETLFLLDFRPCSLFFTEVALFFFYVTSIMYI